MGATEPNLLVIAVVVCPGLPKDSPARYFCGREVRPATESTLLAVCVFVKYFVPVIPSLTGKLWRCRYLLSKNSY